MSEHDQVIQPILVVPCPICHKHMEVRQVQDWPQFPFCSPRCKLIDLGRWLGEDYRLPESEVEPTSPSDDPAT